MIDSQQLENVLCKNFCDSITVNPVAAGLAISLAFKDNAGDKIGIYLSNDDDHHFHLEDSGSYLAELHARGLDISRGERMNLLDSILKRADAYWDRDTYDIRTMVFPKDKIAEKILSFISALIRVRDVEFLTKDMVRSTFKEDAYAVIESKFKSVANVNESTPVSKQLGDYIPDITIESARDSSKKLAIYLANSAVSFQEAELLHAQIERESLQDKVRVVALIEDTDKLDAIGRRRFQRAQNRGMTMPIFRNEEEASVDLIYNRDFKQLNQA